jgi:hypothetical protein
MTKYSMISFKNLLCNSKGKRSRQVLKVRIIAFLHAIYIVSSPLSRGVLVVREVS